MKKLIVLMLGLVLSSSLFAAQIVIFNMSNDNVMDVEYSVCSIPLEGQKPQCQGVSIAVPNRTDATRNYKKIGIGAKATDNYMFHVKSASAKDKDGKVVSNGGGKSSMCQFKFSGDDEVAVRLDDMKGSPMITCTQGGL